MIWRSREPRYDVASGISQGARDYQEDAITADFPLGAEAGFVVLADGFGFGSRHGQGHPSRGRQRDPFRQECGRSGRQQERASRHPYLRAGSARASRQEPHEDHLAGP